MFISRLRISTPRAKIGGHCQRHASDFACGDLTGLSRDVSYETVYRRVRGRACSSEPLSRRSLEEGRTFVLSFSLSGAAVTTLMRAAAPTFT